MSIIKDPLPNVGTYAPKLTSILQDEVLFFVQDILPKL